LSIRLGVYAYKEYEEFPWSSFKELSRGTAIDLVVRYTVEPFIVEEFQFCSEKLPWKLNS